MIGLTAVPKSQGCLGKLEYNPACGGKSLYLTFFKVLGAPGERADSQNILTVLSGFPHPALTATNFFYSLFLFHCLWTKLPFLCPFVSMMFSLYFSVHSSHSLQNLHQLKQIHTLRQMNEQLLAENRALTRVVARLSLPAKPSESEEL